MIFSKQSVSENLEISINDFKLERVYVIKFLGVLIASDLKWKAQVSAVHKKICKNLALMTKTRSKLSSEALLKLYHVLIQPHFYSTAQKSGVTAVSLFYHLSQKSKRVLLVGYLIIVLHLLCSKNLKSGNLLIY